MFGHSDTPIQPQCSIELEKKEYQRYFSNSKYPTDQSQSHLLLGNKGQDPDQNLQREKKSQGQDLPENHDTLDPDQAPQDGHQSAQGQDHPKSLDAQGQDQGQDQLQGRNQGDQGPGRLKGKKAQGNIFVLL